ncbi:MAG: hypothetical protein NDI67_15080 [Sulfuritalea sp.]|nr:hypothetical protein [Sulfuritalea sp.]
MKTPYRQRRLLSLMTLAIASLFHAGTAFAQAPATGRYRCYEPPSYTVMAWFDLDAKGISVHGDAPQAVRIDTAKGRLDLPRDALPPYRHGFYFPPGAAGGDAERVTIVLTSRADQRPGRSGWVNLPRCYLTTH